MAEAPQASLSVVFVGDQGLEEGVGVAIEQLPWESNIGQITKADLYKFLLNMGTTNTFTNTVDCGLNDDGSITSIIYCAPVPSDLAFDLKTSYGELQKGSLENINHNENIHVLLETEFSLSYRPVDSVAWDWVDNKVWDAYGQPTTLPEVSIVEGKVTISKPVVGILKTKYFYVRHEYILTASPRALPFDAFGAVVYAIYDGGISWLEITNPPYVDEIASGEMECGNQPPRVYELEEDEDDRIPDETDVPLVDRKIQIDYCSQEVLKDEVVYRLGDA